MKSSNIGGQAVLEGIMMKNKDTYATAVRKPDGEIVIQKDTYVSMTEKVKFFSLPLYAGFQLCGFNDPGDEDSHLVGQLF